MEKNLIYTVEHNSFGVLGVFDSPEKVKEFLEARGIQNQDAMTHTWTQSTNVFAWEPNTDAFLKSWYPRTFMDLQ